ncbi:hypothetical protein LAZ67_2007023 [Cordylochernes scorpioides]|uniref:superoxide dismutase n=1 Tax=Cordylochernes scorpioides TaxID=51811 RepID=A0ABY6K8M3_9ARAC|nr:hypothetical protein LAZ67_2007023 [Cordylochernes scorpioides]
MSRTPSKYRTALQVNAGGYFNHALYYAVLSPNPNNEERRPTAELAADIQASFRSTLEFQFRFTEAALGLVGSGWVWLCRNTTANSRRLLIITTANEDTPLPLGLRPLIALDVWEHAYFLKHRERRDKYVTDWWGVLDWEAVDRLDGWWSGLRDSTHDEL